MIRKVVKKGSLKELSEINENLKYWMSRRPEERVEAIELLWRERHGDEARLQRIARVVQRSRR